MAIAAIVALPVAICAATASYVTYGLGRATKKPPVAWSKFAVGHVVAEAAEPHSALEVVAVEDGLYTLRYKTDDAWRGHEITRLADDLVPFGASLPKRAKPVTTYRED